MDPDDETHISSAKKPRVSPDSEKKIKCLKFIIYLFEELIAKLPVGRADITNITQGNQLMNIIFSVYNMERQKANGINGAAARKAVEK